MAKRGLGRGLGSLFGEDYAAPATPEVTAPRVVVDADKEIASAAAQDAAEIAPPALEQKEEVESAAAAEDVAAENDSSAVNNGELIPEDNVIIQGVTERVVSRPAKPAAQKPAPQSMASKVDNIPAAEPRVIDELELAYIKPNPNQPRMSFKKEELEELASSIQKDGLLQPIVVRKLGEQNYQIIAGERRYQACKSLGMKKVPVRIKEASDDEALELALIENIQREDLNPIEEAYGYRRIMEHKHLTQAEVAQMLSKGRSTIANALRLLDLPEDAQQLLYEEKITAGHARAILSVPTPEGRQKLTEKLMNEKLTVRETESLARLLGNKPVKEGAEPAKRTATPKSFKAVAKSLRQRLDTNVRVTTVQGKNKIEIEFKDEEELERLFNLMTKGE